MLERLSGADLWRLELILNAFSKRTMLNLMFAAMWQTPATHTTTSPSSQSDMMLPSIVWKS